MPPVRAGASTEVLLKVNPSLKNVPKPAPTNGIIRPCGEKL